MALSKSNQRRAGFSNAEGIPHQTPRRDERHPLGEQDQPHKSDFQRRNVSGRKEDERLQDSFSSSDADDEMMEYQRHQFFEAYKDQIMDQFRDQYKHFQEGETPNPKR